MLVINVPNSILVVFIILIVLAGTILLMVKSAYNVRSHDQEMIKRGSHFVPREVNPNKPVEKKVGKLVKKSIDYNSMRRHYRYRYGLSMPIGLKEDYFYRYYLRFETYDGYKDFTVSKTIYQKYRVNTYGFIYYQKSRFSHFEIRKKESLGIKSHE